MFLLRGLGCSSVGVFVYWEIVLFCSRCCGKVYLESFIHLEGYRDIWISIQAPGVYEAKGGREVGR